MTESTPNEPAEPAVAAAAEAAPAGETAPAQETAPAAETALAGASNGTASQPPYSEAPGKRPGFLFFGIVAAITLLLDIISKGWAEVALTARPAHDSTILLIKDHLTLSLAYNKGGAWGLLQDQREMVRLPFFLAVSVLAVLFIVSLYGKLGSGQNALRWGLPLVLGGALGNLSDRITRSSVIDFIDYRADWVLAMNRLVAHGAKGWSLTDHWPTFNVADIAICIGVGLMAIDMFTARRGHLPHVATPAPAGFSEPPAS
jgi:signal peptidase II